jgi:hypothetical protein
MRESEALGLAGSLRIEFPCFGDALDCIAGRVNQIEHTPIIGRAKELT